MPRRSWSRLMVGALAAVAPLAGFVAVPPASAQESTVGRSVRLAAISPFIGPDDPLQLAVQVGNPTELAIEDVSLRVAVFGRVSSRSALREALDIRPATPLIGAVEEPVADEISPGELRTVMLERAAAALSPAITNTGVYPIEIQVRHSRGDVTLRTAVPFFASPPERRLNVAWILSIDRPVVARADGTYDDEALRALRIDELTQQMEELARFPNARVTLAINGALLDTLTDLADGFVRRTADATTTESSTSPTAQQAGTLLDAMRQAAAGASQIATAPYARAHLPSLAEHGLRGDLLRQITAGRSTVAERLGRSPDASLLVPPGLVVGHEAARSLPSLGVSGLVVDPDTLPQQPTAPFRPALFGPSRPVELEVRGGRLSFRALLPDRALRARLDGPERGILLAQAVMAETASAWLELPGLADQRLIVLASSDLPSPPALRAALDAFSRAPWLTLRSASDALAALPPRAAPLPVPQLDPPDTVFLAAAREARRALSIFGSIAVGSPPGIEQAERAILLAESSEWAAAPQTGASLARAVTGRVAEILAGIDVVERPVTLTARRGDVPVTILNKNAFPIRVRVRLDSAKLTFPSGASRTVEIAAQDTTIDFAVETRATGSFPLTVVVETPDGVTRVTSTRVVLRSTAVSAVALAVVGGSALFLLVAWMGRARRRPRREPAAAEDADPGTASTTG